MLVRRAMTAAVTAMLLAGLVPAGAAYAADAPSVDLSVDGSHYVAGDVTIPAPGGAWVPGDTRTVTVWARNGSEATADTTIDVDLTRESLFARELVMTVTLDGGQPVPVPASTRLDAGQVVRVDVRLAFPATSDNPSMLNRSRLDVTVAMQGDTTDTGPVGRSVNGHPDSGVDIRPAYLGLGLLVGGMLLLAARRRRHSATYTTEKDTIR